VVQVTASKFEEKVKMAAADQFFEITRMEPNLVQYRAENGIAFLTLNDPPANTYSYEMMQTLDARILAARMDESVQVIVLTGNGEKFFSAGANIQMLANVTPTFKYFFCLHANETLSRLEQTPKLVIAAILGGVIGLERELKGKPVIVYFYPKDDTPGCTKEACDFRDNLRAFNSAKVRVLGVSPDDSKRHAKFKEKYGLTFTLLSDTEKKLIEAYGIWIKKLNYGREYMGVQRSTFLVDKSGKVVRAWNGVRVPGHVEAVITSLG